MWRCRIDISRSKDSMLRRSSQKNDDKNRTQHLNLQSQVGWWRSTYDSDPPKVARRSRPVVQYFYECRVMCGNDQCRRTMKNLLGFFSGCSSLFLICEARHLFFFVLLPRLKNEPLQLKQYIRWTWQLEALHYLLQTNNTIEHFHLGVDRRKVEWS